ncbi:MAG: mannose-1-phosphate guanylyltransferase [Rubricoccaceae bacterium]|nr:mannose-1-phosphate guanylyltransferase [Rubricoccaceae bacterium]
MSLYAVIMAGGVGSRFWPRSRRSRPKQFLDVLGPDSLIQNTFARLQPLVQPENVFVVTNEDYISQTQEHLPAIPLGNILGEPIARNTAPCIAFAAARLLALDPEAVMIVLPADHLIRNVSRFHEVLHAAVAKAQESGSLVTIGIEPTHPATGYGYIQYDSSVRDDWDDVPQAYAVKTFAEKPDLATAERFLDTGDFLWNSGMFIWRADTVLETMRRHLPDVHRAFMPLSSAFHDEENTTAAVREAYTHSPKISIDYGVMEPAAAEGNVYVVPGAFGWSDVGDWKAVYDLSEKDASGNAVEGNVLLHNTSRSYAKADKNRLLALVGMRDTVVVDTGDAVLVCKLDATQQVKTIVDYLSSHGMDGSV